MYFFDVVFRAKKKPFSGKTRQVIVDVLLFSSNSSCFLVGNAIGDDGIEEVRGWLESNGCLHTLGSMSEDEGESDVDEEKNDEGGEEDELGGQNNESDEGEDVAELDFKVTGVGLKPQSPLLGTDEEVENELTKVSLFISKESYRTRTIDTQTSLQPQNNVHTNFAERFSCPMNCRQINFTSSYQQC